MELIFVAQKKSVSYTKEIQNMEMRNPQNLVKKINPQNENKTETEKLQEKPVKRTRQYKNS